MKFASKDINETAELAELLAKIDNIDAKYVNEISDEIFKKQPFLLSVLLGYRLDLSMAEMEEIMKIYFLIWEYFKQNKNVQAKKVTEAYFEEIQNKNMRMLQYVEGEPEDNGKLEIYSNDLEKLQSKALLTAVLFRYNSRSVILKMDEEKRGIILIGIKSFIECFETL